MVVIQTYVSGERMGERVRRRALRFVSPMGILSGSCSSVDRIRVEYIDQ